MRTSWSARAGVVAFAVLTGSGCALTSKSDPILLRYFTPERPSVFPGTSARSQDHGLELRLGRINAASSIKDRIAFRDGDLEIGYYEELRWTEKPESYLRRAMGRALFEEQGVKQLASGAGPTLEIELDSFEEVRAPRHVARVQVTWMIRDEIVVREQKTFTIERPIEQAKSANAPGAIAAAMSDALTEAVKTISTAVLANLSKREREAGDHGEGSEGVPLDAGGPDEKTRDAGTPPRAADGGSSRTPSALRGPLSGS